MDHQPLIAEQAKWNNTSWRPESCRECSCHSDVAVCRLSRCPNPQCDFQRHDSQWSPSPCSLCSCSRGGVACSSPHCPPLSCPGDQSLFTPTGECCPKCGRNGASIQSPSSLHPAFIQPPPSLHPASIQPPSSLHPASTQPPSRLYPAFIQPPPSSPSRLHPDFIQPPSSLHPASTQLPIRLYPAFIQPPPSSPSRLHPASIQPPHPTPGSCSWGGVSYRDGEEWAPSLCSRCPENLVIQPGRCCPQCVSNPCLSAGKQHQGQTKVKRAGECCGECAAAAGSCAYEGATRYHGDMWNTTGCQFCSCNRGQVVCHRAECGRVACPQDLARWSDGGCRECECSGGRATCYLLSCPTCPPGTLVFIRAGGCCPECHRDQRDSQEGFDEFGPTLPQNIKDPGLELTTGSQCGRWEHLDSASTCRATCSE
ncbi:Extracellular matrix protein FRAS1 [Liparis tanakae]|uniref:Extracellular matrix protein FRAS1 n=1 Tax=Liparis tanakae TaxID=230148 RepID=A0A4Z2FRL8_9TELE|nr:Extracellular matrix protein FRAS1 [Liparis tanakae]